MRAATIPTLADYGLIGDGRTAALVSREGSVDWLCLPGFSSPGLFAAILDQERGGRLSLRPTDPFRIERHYVRDTAVFETSSSPVPTGVVRGLFLLTVTPPLLPYVHPRGASEYDAPGETPRLEPPGFPGLNCGRRPLFDPHRPRHLRAAPGVFYAGDSHERLVTPRPRLWPPKPVE